MNQQALTKFIAKGLDRLNLEAIHSIVVYARQKGKLELNWTQRIALKLEREKEVKHEPNLITVQQSNELSVEKDTTKLEIKSKTKQTTDRTSIGCLSLLIIIGFVWFLFHSCQGTPEPTSAVSRQDESSGVDNLSKISTFESRLKQVDPDNAIIAGVTLGRTDGEVVIKVTNSWHSQPYQVRLQMAQNLHKIWASISSANAPDKARIK